MVGFRSFLGRTDCFYFLDGVQGRDAPGLPIRRSPGNHRFMPPQYIFTIEKLSKAYAKKEVLKNIWLSFYPGAKIGVIGGNGSGKSTLLRIMAGLDHDFIGTARPAADITIGYVPQEPTLDPDLDVARKCRASRLSRSRTAQPVR